MPARAGSEATRSQDDAEPDPGCWRNVAPASCIRFPHSPCRQARPPTDTRNSHVYSKASRVLASCMTTGARVPSRRRGSRARPPSRQTPRLCARARRARVSVVQRRARPRIPARRLSSACVWVLGSAEAHSLSSCANSRRSFSDFAFPSVGLPFIPNERRRSRRWVI